MTQCTATASSGKQCQGQAISGSTFCFAHDPASGQARAQARKRGGERRRVGHATDAATVPIQVRNAADVLAVLDYTLAEGVLLENSIQRGRLLVAIAGALLEAIKVGELDSRVTTLEAALRVKGAP